MLLVTPPGMSCRERSYSSPEAFDCRASFSWATRRAAFPFRVFIDPLPLVREVPPLVLVPDPRPLLDVGRRVQHRHLADGIPVLHADGRHERALPLLLQE